MNKELLTQLSSVLENEEGSYLVGILGGCDFRESGEFQDKNGKIVEYNEKIVLKVLIKEEVTKGKYKSMDLKTY